MMPDERKYHSFLEILLFSCLGCFSLYIMINSSEIPARYQDMLTTTQAYLAVIILFNGIGLSLMYMNRSIRNAYDSLVSSRRRMVSFIILSAVLLFAVNYLILVIIKLIINSDNPFGLAWHGFRNIFIVWMIEMTVFGLLMATSFYRSLVSLYKRTAELEESAVRTQYQALQNQLNPHFLFNSLNTLISEIEYNPETAVMFTRNLSDVYRYVLQCQDRKLVPLGQELEFTGSYIYLHSVRLGNCLSIENSVPHERYGDMVPSLTMQLLLENIIKHNVISRSRPMHIRIYIDRNTGYLCVSNGKAPKKDVVSSGKGLANLARRYELLCRKQIIIENLDKSFTIKVPLLNEKD